MQKNSNLSKPRFIKKEKSINMIYIQILEISFDSFALPSIRIRMFGVNYRRG